MGYTTYWKNDFEITDAEWSMVEIAVTPILVEHKDIICSEYDKPEESFIIDNNRIVFNGKCDAGHETFAFQKNGGQDFEFCKTARKPYDLVVCKVLLTLYVIFGDKLNLHSDGMPDDENWPKAFKWISERTNKKIKWSERDKKIITAGIIAKRPSLSKSQDELFIEKVKGIFKSQTKKCLIDILVKITSEHPELKDRYKEIFGGKSNG
jgi:hypothetical protein